MRKLLDAAVVAIDRRGYHATRVNDVVEIAKTSHGTFYLYFSNKEDLLRALVMEAANDMRRLDEELAASKPATSFEEIRHWVGEYSSLWDRYAPLLRAWTDLAAADPEAGRLVRETILAMASTLSGWVHALGAPPGVDPDTAGVAILAMLDRFHFLQGFLDTPIDDNALDTLATLIHRGILDGGPPKASDG